MQYILINTKTLEEFPVEIPSGDSLNPEDFQVLVGEKVFSLSPLTSSEVLDYRKILKDIISLGFKDLIDRYPVKSPSDITDAFKESIAREFDAIVEMKLPDMKAVYMKNRDKAVRDLTITFLNGATAWTEYNDTIQSIKKRKTADDYATDYTNQFLDLFDSAHLAKMTTKELLSELDGLAKRMRYDERTHLLYNDSIQTLDSVVDVLTKVPDTVLAAHVSEAAYEKACPEYTFILKTFEHLHRLAEINKKSMEMADKVTNEYKTNPAVSWLITAKAVVYKFIMDTDAYLRKISQEGSDTMKATYMAEYKQNLTWFFSRYEFVLAAEAKDTRPRDEVVAAKSRTTMYAIWATMKNVRDSKDEEWYKTLAMYFIEHKFELFKDVLTEDELKEALRRKLDETHPLPGQAKTETPNS